MMNKVVTKKLCSTRIIIFFAKNAHKWFANCKAGHNNLDRQFFGKKMHSSPGKFYYSLDKAESQRKCPAS